jgi:hypothetical protein
VIVIIYIEVMINYNGDDCGHNSANAVLFFGGFFGVFFRNKGGGC